MRVEAEKFRKIAQHGCYSAAVMVLKLPWPPSANSIWRRGNNRTYTSKKYREFLRETEVLLEEYIIRTGTKRKSFGRSDKPVLLDGIFDVNIELYPPSRRNRDVDNCIKPILDALTHARVWRDDEDVFCVSARRCHIEKGGASIVTIKPYSAE